MDLVQARVGSSQAVFGSRVPCRPDKFEQDTWVGRSVKPQCYPIHWPHNCQRTASVIVQLLTTTAEQGLPGLRPLASTLSGIELVLMTFQPSTPNCDEPCHPALLATQCLHGRNGRRNVGYWISTDSAAEYVHPNQRGCTVQLWN
jgi:hypothetical protein